MSFRIDGYPIDLALSVKFARKSDVTEYPVERGVNATDHIRSNAPDLDFDGLVSDTPIGAIARDPTRAGVASVSQDAFRRLQAIQDASQPVVVQCSLGTFDSMALTNFQVTRDVKTRKGLKVTLSFKKFRVEDNNRTTVRTSVPGAGGLPDFGLSIDKIIAGKHILWRKGKPPGSSPATDPPGVIVGQEVVISQNHKVTHQNGKPLTTDELTAFAADLNRDTAIFQNRALFRLQKENQKGIQKIDQMQKDLDRKFADKRIPPGKPPNPAAFGR